jgi:radical SAM protein with 4Fe4S-binding SPASM domain
MIGGLHLEARRAYAQAGLLYELHVDLLYQCDLDCEHCYLDDKKKKLLPTAFWKDVFDQAADLGVLSLLISGGEIFLRKDLLELIAHARQRGLFVHLKSHGGYIDEAVAARLADLGVTSVWLSYYATDPAIHDAITRREGSHVKTRAALAHLARAGLVTVASCAVMQRNAHDWRNVVAECDSLGVICSLDGELRAAHSGADFPKQLGLEVDDLVALQRFQLERFPSECTVPLASNDWGTGKSCVAGHLALYISPEGLVTPCIAWPEPLGDLSRGDRLAELWRGQSSPHARRDLSKIKQSTRADRTACLTCPVRADCDFCAGQAFVETRDPSQAIENLCRKTRAKTLAKAAILGLPEPPMPALLSATPPRPRFVIRAKTP